MAQLKTRRTKSRVVALATGLTLAGTGVAFAYWTSTGTGEGTATTGTSAAFVIDSDPAVGDPITPGGAPQTVAFTVTNPSDGGLFLSGVTVAVATATGTAWTSVAGCSAADYDVDISIAPPTGNIAAGASVDGTATIAMLDRPDANQDGCKLAPVPLYFTAITPPA